MLINLESHINMKHTQTREVKKEEEEKIYQEKKGGPSRSDVMRLLNALLILDPKQTIGDENIYHDKKSDSGIFFLSFATLNISSIKSFRHD